MLFFKNKIFNNKIRLRFAPSPTGFLHLGSLRAALFGYLLAKSLGGKFILRIEDTDQKREVKGATESLIKVLKTLGIEFDEGPGFDKLDKKDGLGLDKKTGLGFDLDLGGKYGPYIQTERLEIYKKYADQLLKEGKAYRCFCSAERLTEMRAAQEANKQAPRYDGLCRGLSAEESERRATGGQPFVIRQKMPLDGEVIVHDELRGDIKFKAADLDDQVLMKSDGVPTYQLASVIDDHLMKISHVTRGDEWLPSYPKNFLLYQAFGWTAPKFIHLPLILNKEGGKLSKRKGDVFVEDYLAKGYLPEALVNFCALLGWHPKNDKEIWSLKELKKEFSLAGLGTSPAIFDLEKLDYYNGYYIRQKPLEELAALCRPYLEAGGQENGGIKEQTNGNISNEPKNVNDEIKNDPIRLEKFVALARDRMKKLSDVTELTSFLFALPDYAPELLCWKTLTPDNARANLRELMSELEKIGADKWTKDNLEKTIMAWLKDGGRKNGDYLWPLRVALTGLKTSPGPFEVADALGREESLRRVEVIIKALPR